MAVRTANIMAARGKSSDVCSGFNIWLMLSKSCRGCDKNGMVILCTISFDAGLTFSSLLDLEEWTRWLAS